MTLLLFMLVLFFDCCMLQPRNSDSALNSGYVLKVMNPEWNTSFTSFEPPNLKLGK